jgi:hypothetical protein
MGKPFLIKVDKNGTKYWGDYTCDRCGGQGGADAWTYTGWTCYKCGGTGRMDKPSVWKEYTPEHEEKLNAQRQKKAEKKLAERKAEAENLNRQFFALRGFSEDGDVYVVLGNTYPIKDELKNLGCRFNNILGWYSANELEDYDTLRITADECFDKDIAGVYTEWKMYREDYDSDEGLIAVERKIKEATKAIEVKDEKESDYIGNVGDKITVNVTIKREIRYEIDNPYGFHSWNSTTTMTIYTFVDENDNVLVWKTSGCLYKEYTAENGGEARHFYKEGDTLTIKGTIKAHDVYKGVKQTVLTRVKIVE